MEQVQRSRESDVSRYRHGCDPPEPSDTAANWNTASDLPPLKQARRAILWKIVANALGIIIGLVLMEGVLEFLDKPKLPISGWRSSHHRLELNQLGFRGQRIEYSDNEFIIVLLGDSQVVASQSAYDWMPERRLEHYLNKNGKRVKVFTLGASGYGQDQQLLVLREYFENYRANLVVLWSNQLNDVWNNMFPTHWPADGEPKPTFWLEGGHLRGPSEQMGQKFGPHIKLLVAWQRFFPPSRDTEWERLLPDPYQPMKTFTGQANDDWQQDWNHHLGYMRNENLRTEKSHLTLALTPRSPRMQYGLDLTHQLLGEIEKLVLTHGGDFLTVLMKTPPDKKNSSGEEVHVLNGQYYRTSKKQEIENLNYMYEGFKQYVIPVTVEHWKVGPADCYHLNEHAIDSAMHDLALQLDSLIPNK